MRGGCSNVRGGWRRDLDAAAGNWRRIRAARTRRSRSVSGAKGVGVAAMRIAGGSWPMNDDAVAALLAKAREVLAHAYSPYSRFPVAAAALTPSGRIFAAPNIENASYGLTVCAERNAIFHAVAAGERNIAALLLYTPTNEPHTPCGACRQVMAEFMQGGAPVYCATEDGAVRAFTVDALLPAKFSL
jgi:cytidine deaminase